MNAWLRAAASCFLVVAAVGCAKPDVVLRPDHHFTKESSITLVCVTSDDPAIFKPELEKELMRRGYNVISESTAAVVEEERKSGNVEAQVVKKDDPHTEKSVAGGHGDQLTQKQTARHLKSDYSGNIQYLYDVGDHEVRRVNFTIVDLRTGSIIASIGYERGGKNVDIAKAISTQLDLALRGVKPAGLADLFGLGGGTN
jgi:hypothetical protein